MTINSSFTSTQTYMPSTVAHLPSKMHLNVHSTPPPVAVPPPTNLRSRFITQYKDLQAHRRGEPVVVNGQSLTVPALAAVARYYAPLVLDGSQDIKDKLVASRSVIVNKVNQSKSVYGVSTGFGGSADTRTNNPLALGAALLQHQQSGVLPSSTDAPLSALPLLDPMASTIMPEAWVRGAMLVRINSLLRGHSGVRLELIERMADLITKNITPVVPIRGSVSASGDLAPLSYVAGTLVGNPAIRVFDGPAAFGPRSVVSSRDALAKHGLSPIALGAKEHLGILNGTAFSTSVAALALNDAVHLALLAQVCTAMGTEALNGMRGSFAPFIHKEARPHPGQVEAAQTIWELLEGSKFAVGHENEVTIDQDAGELRQDRYPLRTAPQFLGPQIEDILAAYDSISLEANSTTDNPLIDAKTGEVHHGGNFQAMAVSNAMEKTRLSLHHIGKLLFAQTAELVNPQQNRGLPPSLAATDPSHNYHGKGIDIAAAAYVGELGYLANPVSTHVQSAEMHNQAVNSLALISARATLNSLDVLSMLIASYLYLLCQAYDLRALQAEFRAELAVIVTEELDVHFPGVKTSVLAKVLDKMYHAFDNTSTMDAAARMARLAEDATGVLLHHYTTDSFNVSALSAVPEFRSAVSRQATDVLVRLRREYLHGERGPAPASKYLLRTRPMYEFVRKTLGIRMHGAVNETNFVDQFGGEDSIGQNVSLIHEAIRDGKMQSVVVDLLS